MIAYRNPQYTNGRAAGSAQSVVELCDPVYYVSPLVTLTRRGYTKHYFEGERRICSSIGGCVVKPCLITAVFESAERSSTTAGTSRVPFSAPDGRYRKHPQDAFFTHGKFSTSCRRFAPSRSVPLRGGGPPLPWFVAAAGRR